METIKTSIDTPVNISVPLHGTIVGLSAYQIAVKHGFEGTESEWLESLSVPVESKMDITNPSGSGSFSIDRTPDSDVGENSFAVHGTASGLQSVSFGGKAIGAHTLSIGQDVSITKESTTRYEHKAVGEYSVAIGMGNITNGTGSVSFGVANNVQGTGSFAAGAMNTINCTNDAVLNRGGSVVMGYSNTVSGQHAVAMGAYNSAIGNRAVAMGYKNISNGTNAVVMGSSNTASGNSLVAGWYNKSEGIISTVFGQHNETAPNTCLNFVTGNYAITTTDFSDMKYMDNGTEYQDLAKYAHVVGNGYDSDHRSNAHTLDWHGNAEYQGDVVAFGCGSDESPISLKALQQEVQLLRQQLRTILDHLGDTISEQPD